MSRVILSCWEAALHRAQVSLPVTRAGTRLGEVKAARELTRAVALDVVLRFVGPSAIKIWLEASHILGLSSLFHAQGRASDR